MGDREEEDDDVPQLSAAALAALQEFYEENEAGTTALSHSYTVGAIQEDWVRDRLTAVTLYNTYSVCPELQFSEKNLINEQI
ncbi:EEF1A lysine methyltransferase 1 [Tachysurus ichikawai]